MKSLGLLFIRCYAKESDPTFIVGVKPMEIVFYKKSKQTSSISLKRVKNVYYKDKKVVLELYFLGKNDQN